MKILLLLLLLQTAVTAQEIPAYKNRALPVEERVNDLVPRMTLEEKAAQLTSTMPMLGFGSDAETSFIAKDGRFVPEGAEKFFKNGIGQISRPGMRLGPKEMAEFTNMVQKWIMENTRLGIPVMFHEEALHGLAASKATSFPQAIALASTWNPDLVNKVFSATALEVRSRGAQQVRAPVLDIVSDPRWGRTEETYGEDPYLASRIGVAAVTGFQGRSAFIGKANVIATGKHFAVHGQPENGTNVGPGNYSERVIREFFLKPFEAAVKEANLESIMPSYNEIDGIPAHASTWLLDNILRGEWGFRGSVVSDYYGIKELKEKHFVAGSKQEAVTQAIEAGVDIELPYTEMYDVLVELVKKGVVSEHAIDKCVRRVLRSKFITGLFDDPFVDPDYAEKVYKNPEHKALALKAAREAIILLKNENSLLPL
ncbi:MAG: glycoside hydrolase family 3 protein, partial [Deltaproteobacteria bacterium]|nr:glycoside hydrolase family 3 protein [Deltaproteobacteria bacterium]